MIALSQYLLTIASNEGEIFETIRKAKIFLSGGGLQ